ncbi:response regulator transcription factor [Clostridium estertheticum]|uniref:response regulator transcription factor n=1 Tax=Clostridium estertheticum TaxID=238834 RepID=UPI001C7D3546|nr:response regulator transcription factor [Clostridium estertheticum]MBX4270261.1 response regulator transcription factor [Clostridium estertheticum]WLC79763.1 response regulator transcription factor [Clostridium estertheticum]
MNIQAKEEINILIVDDEESIVEFIKMGLEAEGYIIHTAYDGSEAIRKAKEIKPQIIILDIMLPGVNGFDVCLEIKKHLKTSIIMLTAKDDIDDRVLGLDIGADDYMVKPFSFKELLARINARLRNMFPELADIVRVGDFSINDGAHEIIYGDRILILSPTEYNLIKYLLLNNGLVLSKRIILEKVWGYDFIGQENIVEVYVGYLRDKLQDKEHNIICTVRGVGYKVSIL